MAIVANRQLGQGAKGVCERLPLPLVARPYLPSQVAGKPLFDISVGLWFASTVTRLSVKARKLTGGLAVES